MFQANATDEDGDDLTVTWMSGGVTLGTGLSLEYKGLKAGTHVIEVSVSDGETSVEEELTVEIKKRKPKESPGLGIVVTLTALLVAMAFMTSKMDRRRERSSSDR